MYRQALTCLQEVLSTCGTSDADKVTVVSIGPAINVIQFACSDVGLQGECLMYESQC